MQNFASDSSTFICQSIKKQVTGLMSVRGAGSLDVTEDQHKFVLDVPDAADKDTA